MAIVGSLPITLTNGTVADALQVMQNLNFIITSVNNSAAGLGQVNLFTAGQSVTPIALVDGATISTNAALGNNFFVTLAGNRTLSNPINLANGQIVNWRITQDGTGSRTLSYGGIFKWPSGSAPVLTTAAGAVDFIVGQYWSDTNVLLCNYLKGFA